MEHSLIRDLNQIRVFAKVAELKSVTAAARVLAMPKSTVSRALVRLESDIGVALLTRSNRRVELTDAGRLLQVHADQVLGEIAEAEAALGRAHSAPRGLLRVNAPLASGDVLIAPLLPAFLERYPEIDVELDLDNRRVDLLAEDVDVAIRVGQLTDSSLIMRRLATVEFALYASPGYLREHAPPKTPRDLADHAVVGNHSVSQATRRSGPVQWTLLDSSGATTAVAVKPRLSANSPTSARLSIIGDVGIGWLPTFLARSDVDAGRLVPVLSGFRQPSAAIHAVFSSRRLIAPKLRVFLDYLAERFAAIFDAKA